MYHQIEWTHAALSNLWRTRVLEPRRQQEETWSFWMRQVHGGEQGPYNQEGNGVFVDHHESGYNFNMMSTGVNGTHHKVLSIPFDDERSPDAIAQLILSHTRTWPGWRTIYVEPNSEGFCVQLCGGYYSNARSAPA